MDKLNYRVKIVKDLGQGTDSIAHLIGKTFPVLSVDEQDLCIVHDRNLVPLDHE